jgi:hypothetical protein
MKSKWIELNGKIKVFIFTVVLFFLKRFVRIV